MMKKRCRAKSGTTADGRHRDRRRQGAITGRADRRAGRGGGRCLSLHQGHTRITAQVVRRHARLGDHVKQDQPLVTLSSVEMAEAQGILLETEAELRRVEKLGREMVSDKRFVAAQVAYQHAYAKARAYGMTEKQIDVLVKAGDAAKATGNSRCWQHWRALSSATTSPSVN